MAKHTKVSIGGRQYYKVQITRPDKTRKTLYARTIAELRQKEHEYRLKLGEAPQKNITVRDYAQKQLALIQKNVSRATYVGYTSKVDNYILPRIGDRGIETITRDDISIVLGDVAHLSASSYRQVHMILRRIFVAAAANKLVDNDPTAGIPCKGGVPQKERSALSDDQVETLLNAVHGLPVETFVLIGLYAGLRREESLALKWEFVHLDCEHPYLEVRNAWRTENNRPIIDSKLKTPAAQRSIPIPAVLADHLRTLLPLTTSEYVICNSNGQPLSETQWKHYWRKVTVRTTTERTYTRYANGHKEVHTVKPELGSCAKQNPSVRYTIPFKVTSHQLRHTYVTNLIHAGMDPKTVQYLAGHEDIKITMATYAKAKYNRPEDLSAPINAAFAQKNATKEEHV